MTNQRLGGYGKDIVVHRNNVEAGFIEGYHGGLVSTDSIESGMLRVVGTIYENPELAKDAI